MLVRIYEQPEDLVAVFFECKADESEDAAVAHADGRGAREQQETVESIRTHGCWGFVDSRAAVPIAHVWTSGRQGLREVIGMMAGNLAASSFAEDDTEARHLMEHYTEFTKTAFDLAMQALEGPSDYETDLSPPGELQ